jgi:uncharacterized protein (TIGR02646 family)
MRRLTKPELSNAVVKKLQSLTCAVQIATDPGKEVRKRWKTKHKASFEEIRSALETMASGRSRCMYCEDSLGTDIEHFWPKATYPERAFLWSNYLLACSHCNSNLKRTLFPLDVRDEPLLIDPTVDDPAKQLLLVPTTGEYRAIGPKGAPSITVFGLNDDRLPRKLPQGRRAAIINLTALLKDYDQTVTTDPAWADEIKEAATQSPFGAVFDWLMATAKTKNAARVLGADVVTIVVRHNMDKWRQ